MKSTLKLDFTENVKRIHREKTYALAEEWVPKLKTEHQAEMLLLDCPTMHGLLKNAEILHPYLEQLLEQIENEFQSAREEFPLLSRSEHLLLKLPHDSESERLWLDVHAESQPLEVFDWLAVFGAVCMDYLDLTDDYDYIKQVYLRLSIAMEKLDQNYDFFTSSTPFLSSFEDVEIAIFEDEQGSVARELTDFVQEIGRRLNRDDFAGLEFLEDEVEQIESMLEFLEMSPNL